MRQPTGSFQAILDNRHALIVGGNGLLHQEHREVVPFFWLSFHLDVFESVVLLLLNGARFIVVVVIE